MISAKALDPYRDQMTGNWKQRAIPLSFHGDGVPVTGVGKSWSKTKVYYSWESLLASGDTMETMIYIYGCWKHAFVKTSSADTRREIWQILSWSFSWLAKGEWPDKDWHTKPWPANSWMAQKAGERVLAGGYKGWLLFMKGDLEFLWEVTAWICLYK